MLKAIWEWWNTPMVPRSELIELRCKHIELMVDIDDIRKERNAMRLDRDKAVGKFEYVETAKRELESKLADRDSYIRLLEGQLRQYTENEPEDDFDDFLDDEDVDGICAGCDQELDDCDCDDDFCEDDEHNICGGCGRELSDCDCDDSCSICGSDSECSCYNACPVCKCESWSCECGGDE